VRRELSHMSSVADNWLCVAGFHRGPHRRRGCYLT